MGKKQEPKTKNLKKRKVDPTKKYFNPRTRNEAWDLDYLETLPKKEREWMKRFMNEYVNASLEVEKDPLVLQYAEWNGLKYTRAKNEMIGGGYEPKDKPKNSLHKTKEQAKDIFDSNNQRNNDLFGVTKINNLLEYDVEGLAKKKDIWIETNPNNTEEAMVNFLDYKRDPSAAKKARKRHLKRIKKKDSL